MQNKKKILIIGNGNLDCTKIEFEHYEAIVVFNLCKNFDRIVNYNNLFYFINYGLINDKSNLLTIKKMVDNASKIFFPVSCPPWYENIIIYFNNILAIDKCNKPRFRNTYIKFISNFNAKEKTIIYFSNKFRNNIIKYLINNGMSKKNKPSTGFSAIYLFLNDSNFSNFEIEIIGFEWVGISCHDWNIERKIVENWIKNKKIRKLNL